VLVAPLDHGSHDSAFNQAKLILAALGASEAHKALIAAAFPKANASGA
jgi:hypothetical protein